MSTNDVYLDEKGDPAVGVMVGSRMAEENQKEKERARAVRRTRAYYEGTQFDNRNKLRMEALGVSESCMPEHEKLHAYSTQIQDSVDFIANQMTDSFQLTAEDPTVQELVLTALGRSEDLQSGYDASNLSITNVLRDALICMDAPAYVRWDAVEQTAWPEFWNSEQVQFVYEERRKTTLERVIVRQAVWTTDFLGQGVKKIERTEWYLTLGLCQKAQFWDDEEAPYMEPENLRIPFIPWVSLRATAKARGLPRGQSAITRQATAAADRYNAVEQVAYLIARYNSHGNLAVIGDGATLKAQMEEHISKDVADILTFPGGTALQTLSLPTDPEMIEHQRLVLLEALYGTFGLARTDQESLNGMGQVTGYALEILNRKSEGTFTQIRNQFVGDFKKLVDMILDMHAYLHEDGVDPDQIELAVPVSIDGPESEWDALMLLLNTVESIDPKEVFPNRKFDVQLGSAYVVDHAMTRADYTAGLLSRKEVLRQRGYSEPDIKRIEEEIEAEKPEEPETGLSASGVAAAQKAISAGAVTNNGKTPNRTDGGK